MKAFLVLTASMGLGATALLVGSMYTINEGHVGVITEWSKAVRQEKPAGLKFRTPIVVGVQEFNVQERIIEGTLSAATSNQLSTAIAYSANWRPDPDQILAIYVNYGSPEEFANNVIRTRLNQSLKSVVGKFTGAQLIRERENVAESMLMAAKETLEFYPAFIESIQIENFELPGRYMEAVLQKEEQREATDKESLLLEQQGIQAQREVQTAKAAAESQRASADARAYETRTLASANAERTKLEAEARAEATKIQGEAEAKAIEARQNALSNNPLYIEYVRWNRWDGTLPQTIFGSEGPELLMQMPTGK